MALYCIRDLEIAGPELLAVVESSVHDPDVSRASGALAVLSRIHDSSGQSVRIMLECLKSDSDAACAAPLPRRSAIFNFQCGRDGLRSNLPRLNPVDEVARTCGARRLDRLEKR